MATICIEHFECRELDGLTAPVDPHAVHTHDPKPGSSQRKDAHPQWKADAIGYKAAHDRVLSRYGKAAKYLCMCGCNRRAREWAYYHIDSAGLRDELGAYSFRPDSIRGDVTCNVPPFASAVLDEATRLCPNRRKSSDGCCGDRAHQASVSDHNPSGPHNYAHAVDVSHSVPGAPFWESRFGRFDAMAQARKIAGRITAGTERRVKYLVANFGGPDMIFDPAVSMAWRQNGSFKTDHRSHLHVSFTVGAEQSTAPFFVSPEVDDVTPQDKKDIIDGVLKVLRRQPDGSPGLIGDEVAHVFGGYPDGVKYEDGVLIQEWRKDKNVAKR